jgi:hypothetical protein
MLTPPASFLPYPVDILEDALNIVAKERYDAGDREIAETIQGHMALHLVAYFLPNSKKIMTDEEALEKMRDTLDLILNNPPLKEVVLENLRNSQRSWMDTRQAPVPDGRGEIVNVSQRIAHNCEVCGRARITTLVKFKQNVSYIFRRQEKTFHGWACFRCMAEKFLTFEFVTLIGTWWGIIGCLFGPVYLVLNAALDTDLAPYRPSPAYPLDGAPVPSIRQLRCIDPKSHSDPLTHEGAELLGAPQRRR